MDSLEEGEVEHLPEGLSLLGAHVKAADLVVDGVEAPLLPGRIHQHVHTLPVALRIHPEE